MPSPMESLVAAVRGGLVDEFTVFDAVGQAELVRQRQVSPLELV